MIVDFPFEAVEESGRKNRCRAWLLMQRGKGLKTCCMLAYRNYLGAERFGRLMILILILKFSVLGRRGGLRLRSREGMSFPVRLKSGLGDCLYAYWSKKHLILELELEFS